jgi:hypothetical protein
VAAELIQKQKHVVLNSVIIKNINFQPASGNAACEGQ